VTHTQDIAIRFNATTAWDFAVNDVPASAYPLNRNMCRAVVLRFACEHFPEARAWEVESVASGLHRIMQTHA